MPSSEISFQDKFLYNTNFGSLKRLWHYKIYYKKSSTNLALCWNVTAEVLVGVVQSLSHVWLFVTPWTAACQASLSFTISWSLLKLMSIESMMLSNHLNLCRSPLLLPSVFPSFKVFSNESVLCIRWTEYWSSGSASVLPMNIQDWFPLGWTGWTSLQSKGLSGVFSNTTLQKHQFSGAQLSSPSNSHIHTWPQEKP